MNVGDRRTIRGKPVEIESLELDSNGYIGIFVLEDGGRYRSNADPNDLDPEHPTWRATHPDLGQVTIDLPVDGQKEQKAVWSQAATDAATVDTDETV